MTPSNANRIRLAVFVFPISGLIAALGALVPGIGIDPSSDPAGFARAANLVGIANLAGLVSVVLLLFGFQALYAFLAGSSVDNLAFIGMELSIGGATLFASFLGIIVFVGPIAGSHYLNGQVDAIGIVAEAVSSSSLPVLIFGGFSLISYVIGSVLFGVAIWRFGKLPKWSAVSYVLSTPLSATPHYVPTFWFLGGMLLFVSGIGIVRGVWRFQGRH